MKSIVARNLPWLLESEHLREVDVGWTAFTMSNLKKTSDCLTMNQTLKKLFLCGNNIGDDGAMYLCRALCKNTSLSYLRLQYNGIGDEGAKHISTLLSINSTLIYLSLSGNEIGDDGTKHLSDALINNITITSFYVDGNQMGDVGAKYLSDLLSVNTTLTKLRLCHNRITPAVYNSFIMRDIHTDYIYPSSEYWPTTMKSLYSIACISIPSSKLETIADDVDESKVTHFIVDGTQLKNGVIPSWVMKMTKLRSLRFT